MPASVSAADPTRVSLGVRLRRAGGVGAVLALVAVMLYAKAIPCAFARVFHLPCPGCGSTRAVMCLLHGDLAGVFHYNPLGPVMALLLGVLGVQSLVSVLRHGDARGAGEGRVGTVVTRGIYVVVALELILWGARFLGAFGGPVPV